MTLVFPRAWACIEVEALDTERKINGRQRFYSAAIAQRNPVSAAIAELVELSRLP